MKLYRRRLQRRRRRKLTCTHRARRQATTQWGIYTSKIKVSQGAR